MKVTVVGAGYVGLSIATLLSLKNEVVILDVIKEKVDKINNRISPIKDNLIIEYFANKELNLVATLDSHFAYTNSDFVIICAPTNFNENTNKFDVSIIDSILFDLSSINYAGTIIIKSTVPIGYSSLASRRFNLNNIMFSPEFLRESSALYDNMYPSRIIVGANENNYCFAHMYIEILLKCILKKDVETFIMGMEEAEAVKLFANTYLAMRVSFFNELDTYAEMKNLNSQSIIKGVCADKRIGNYYNNPSFGYGGYCLPKDTKQLLYEFRDIPQNMIQAVCNANDTRKKFIAQRILEKLNIDLGDSCSVVGIYRLIMKTDSDNFRNSAIFDIIKKFKI